MLRFCALCLAVACTRPAVQNPRLGAGGSGERTIATGETHRYDVELASGAVLIAEVDQLGADVVVSAYGPDGARVAQFDSPTGGRGTEHVRVDATQAGTYRIEVTTFPGQRGSYRARVVEIVSARELAEREAKERAAVAQFFADRQPVVDAFLSWARESAIGDDFAGLDRVIGDARVIALGEADHGVHEYLAYRNRLAKYLVENHGVTAILVESGFTEATAVDDYVTGTSAGTSAGTSTGTTTATSREVAPAVFSWAMPLALRANIELVEWLRAHNAKAARKVHVYGIDLPGGRNGVFIDSRRAADAALAYLAQHDRAAHQRLLPRLAPLLAKFHSAGYLDLSDAQRAQLTTVIAELLAAFEQPRDTREFQIARQHAAMAAVLETYFRQTRERSSKQELADPSLDGIRDAAMAANVIWALDQEGPNSRAFLFTHNGHARRGAVTSWPGDVPPGAAMGQYLARSLREKLVVIGFLHGDGPPSATLDGLFAKLGRSSFVLDLRSAPEPVRAGFGQPWPFRYDAGRAMGLEPSWSASPLSCFDALVYTSTVRAAAHER